MPVEIIAQYQQREGEVVRCDLCPHHCRLREGQSGRCHVRRVINGRLAAVSYGLVSSAQSDPIEKKPLYHYYPGSNIVSIGGWGCNLACNFCQNWSISQSFDERGEPATPEAILALVRRAGCLQVAYTYNEPLVNYEFVRDCCSLMHFNGIRNVLVTNGFIEPAPAAELLALTDALNLDIKSFDDDFYRRRCGGRLEPVLRFARQARCSGCHLEITHLLVPGNDAGNGIALLGDWIAAELGKSTPLHLSAYHPQYRSCAPATGSDRLLAAHSTAVARLDFVYLGNVCSAIGSDTLCPQCKRVWVRRGSGYGEVTWANVKSGRCSGCGLETGIKA